MVPERIGVVTFNRDAAAELSGRIAARLAPQGPRGRSPGGRPGPAVRRTDPPRRHLALADLREYVPGSRVVYDKNPKFMFPDKPYLDEMTYLFEVNHEAEVAAFRSGQIPKLNTIQIAQIDSIRSQVPNATYEQRSGCCGQSLGTRLDVDPTADLRVRQALSKSLDRSTWLQQIYKGIGYLPWSVYTDLWQEFTMPDSMATSEARYNFEYDVAEAQKLMDSAGDPYAGQTVEMHVFPSPDPIWDQSATLAMDFISKAGVRSELVKREYGAFISTTYRGDYDGLAWFPVGEFSPAGLLNRYTPGAGGRNVNRVDDPQLLGAEAGLGEVGLPENRHW